MIVLRLAFLLTSQENEIKSLILFFVNPPNPAFHTFIQALYTTGLKMHFIQFRFTLQLVAKTGEAENP